jgi:hypothetical protein
MLAGEDKFKGELIRGLNALTGHLEDDIGQIRSTAEFESVAPRRGWRYRS